MGSETAVTGSEAAVTGSESTLMGSITMNKSSFRVVSTFMCNNSITTVSKTRKVQTVMRPAGAEGVEPVALEGALCSQLVEPLVLRARMNYDLEGDVYSMHLHIALHL